MSSKTASLNKHRDKEGGRAWSLAARLTAWYIVSAFALIAISTIILYVSFVKNLDREHDQFLIDKIRVMRGLLRERPSDEVSLREEVEEDWAPRQFARIFVRILSREGRTLFESRGMEPDLPWSAFPAPVPTASAPHEALEISANGKPYRILSAMASVGRSGPGATTTSSVAAEPACILQVALETESINSLLSAYRQRLGIVLVIALVASALVGYRIAHRGFEPVHEIAGIAERIRSSTLHERIPTTGLPAELAALARTCNDMLDRLEASFQRLSRFSADIAHELRTPVNNLRGVSELALSKPRTDEEYQETLISCVEECDRITRIIQALLFLARADDPQTHIQPEQLDVAVELDTVREFYEAAAVDAGISLRIDCASGLKANLDRILFQRAVGNLISNALAYTPSGGVVTLLAHRDNGSVLVAVRDTGKGIPAEHLPHVFDRLYRADAARESTSGNLGLGLALVKSITALHKGTVEIRSEVGRGTQVSLQFPADTDGVN